MHRLVEVARDAPGYVSADLQPPDDAHPGEWVVVYQFADTDSIDAWLRSPVRAELMHQAADLVDGPPREQRVALAPSPEPVTAVASFRVRPGAEHRYREAHQRLADELSRFPGFVRSELFPPVEGVQDETVLAFSFEDRAHLDAWLGSAEREERLAEIDPLLDGGRTVNVVGGFAGWFAGQGRDVKRWKQAAVVLLALVPTSLVLTAVRLWLFPDAHWVVGVLFGNVVGVAALSWVLMPFLTNRLDAWLRS